jgi:methionyl-tRNA synthetase
MKNKILITAALPYANGPLHFGHIAGAYLPADCYARFKRLMGDDVLFICGSDEYGIAITLSAEMAGREPKAHVDIFHAINRDFFHKLGLSFDHYSRTTSSVHTETVCEFFKDLLANGHIEEKVTEQLYSEKDDRFLADRYVVGICPRCGYEEARGDECPKCAASFEATELKNPRSKVTGAPLVRKKTNHWYLRFDHFKKQLQEWLDTKDWKPNVVSFVKHYIDDLQPRAITRDSDWGIPLPIEGAEGKVFYVWFDAPIGYISATKEWDSKAWEKYWLDPKTKYVQFIGKDNIPFHAIFFPAMQMGQNRPFKMVDDLPANEFYHFEGKKFNKSTGWTIDLDRFFSKFSADQIRYVIAANAPETSDSEFTWHDFQSRVNSDLVGKFGNFANRVLTFIANKVSEPLKLSQLDSVDVAFITNIKKLVHEIAESYDSYKLRKAASLVMEMATAGNIYFDHKKPWVMVKDLSQKEPLLTTLGLCLYALKMLSLVSLPIIPEAAGRLQAMLGIESYSTLLEEATVLDSEQMSPTKTPTILFHKVEDAVIEEELALLKEPPAHRPLKEQIAFDDFQKVDLRVATILSAESVPKSKKLLLLTVDLGFEKRQIVSGIALHYENPSDLIGKKVVIVANLKPAKLMGIESQGMILACGEETLELLELKNQLAGSIVS